MTAATLIDCAKCGAPLDENGQLDRNATRLDAYTGRLEAYRALQLERADLAEQLANIPGGIEIAARFGNTPQRQTLEHQLREVEERLPELEAELDGFAFGAPADGLCECGAAAFTNGRLDLERLETASLQSRLDAIDARLDALERRGR